MRSVYEDPRHLPKHVPSWREPKTPGVGSRDAYELTGYGYGVTGLDLVVAFLVDLVVYPLSAWVLRGMTGQSLGDRVANLVWQRAGTDAQAGARPGVGRCIVADLLTWGSLPLSWLPVELVTNAFGLRMAGISVDKTC